MNLRLLHPFMPFLTEAIWTATPHAPDDPELLIVADWPGPEVAGRRDAAAEAEVDVVIDLVRGIRNARSEARLEPAAWLPVDLAADPAVALALEALRPAVERLARARPLTIHPTRSAFLGATRNGGLSVIGSGLEAVVGRAGGGGGTADAAALDRERLQRELGRGPGAARGGPGPPGQHGIHEQGAAERGRGRPNPGVRTGRPGPPSRGAPGRLSHADRPGAPRSRCPGARLALSSTRGHTTGSCSCHLNS